MLKALKTSEEKFLKVLELEEGGAGRPMDAYRQHAFRLAFQDYETRVAVGAVFEHCGFVAAILNALRTSDGVSEKHQRSGCGMLASGHTTRITASWTEWN